MITGTALIQNIQKIQASAALAVSSGESIKTNPYPLGSAAYGLWEREFQKHAEILATKGAKP